MLPRILCMRTYVLFLVMNYAFGDGMEWSGGRGRGQTLASKGRTSSCGRAKAKAVAEDTGRTTRYCIEVMEKIREVEIKMSPYGLRSFSSTSWVAWMVGSVNLSMSLDSW